MSVVGEGKEMVDVVSAGAMMKGSDGACFGLRKEIGVYS